MAQQDDIIEIKTVENITTSILDYFLNVALVTPIIETHEEIDPETGEAITIQGDLLPDAEFSEDGYEVYSSLSAVAEKFATTSKIYKIASSVFVQKNNNGVNQSNLRRFIVIEKKDTDLTFEDALNRVGYKNAYFLLVNQENDSDVTSVNTWVSGYRKLLFVQTSSDTVFDDGDTDLASVLKELSAIRTALYYHADDNESLAGALAAILAGYPIGAKGASYKRPTDITVDKLTDTQEETLTSKFANFYVPFIGGAGDYSTRYLTSANGVTSGNIEIEKMIAVDRIVLSLQASLMDALEQDIPYDDGGGTIVYGKVNKVFASLKKEGVLAEDSVDDTTGEVDKSYTIYVVPIATVKREYSDYYARKEFIVQCTLNIAGVAKRIAITIAY